MSATLAASPAALSGVELCSIAEAEVLLDYPAVLAESFGPAERETLAALRTPKRKREWLAARLAAKRLVGRALAGRGVSLAPAEIGIRSAESRAPYVALPAAAGIADPAWEFPVSLSHGGDLAGCALGRPGERIGFDLERIEPREPGWAELALRPDERSADDGAARLTAVWTAKEAVLKLLGLGLSVSLHDVRVPPDDPPPPAEARGPLELSGGARRAWEALGRPRLDRATVFFDDSCLTLVTGGLHGN